MSKNKYRELSSSAPDIARLAFHKGDTVTSINYHKKKIQDEPHKM